MKPRASICLCMIVRDEAAIIERCLNSCDGLIDTFVIVDTGSTDRTDAVITGWNEGHGLPGELHHRPWVNFGSNRSQMLELAHGKADYLLLLDADMTVWWVEPLPQLTADQYLIRVPGPVEYRLAALVRGDRLWHSVGAAHENIAGDGEFIVREPLNEIVIQHHCDGSRRPNKFIDDARLLRDEHERQPDNPRTVFYLANTLRDLGETREAIFRYRQRVEMGGWDQEIYYSMLQAAVLDDDVAGLFDAWSYRPTRAEALYELAWRFRKRGAHHAALLVADEGRRIPMPDDILFVWPWIYQWGLLFEYALAEQAAGLPNLALKAYRQLLDLPQLPQNYRKFIEYNATWIQPFLPEVGNADRG